jgi:hypothetical protein
MTLLLCFGTLVLSGCPDDTPAEEAMLSQMGASETPAAADPVFELPRDKPVDVSLQFASASHTSAPGKLSNLGFNFSAGWDEQTLRSEKLELSAEKTQDTSLLDLDEFKVEIRPIIDQPVNIERGQYGSYGGYRISVRNAEGESLCCLEVNKKGELVLRSADCSNYLPYQSLAMPKEEKYRYTVYPKGEGKREALLAVEFDGDGFENKDIEDSDGNSYTYRFPNANLKIYNAALVEELKDEMAAEQSAYMGGGGTASCFGGG